MRARHLIPALAALTASCSDTPAGNSGTIISPAAIQTPAIIAAKAAPATAPMPAAAPQALRSVTVDPPLPPELADDTRLKPLPPRPPASALNTGNQN